MADGGQLRYDEDNRGSLKTGAAKADDYEAQGQPRSGDCFCNDVVFAVLFLTYFVVMIVFAIMWGGDGLEKVFSNGAKDSFVQYSIALGVIGLCIAIFWSLLMAFMAAWFINLALLFSICLMFGIGAFMSYELYFNWSTTWFWLPALAFGIIGLLLIVFMIFVQKRIHFASANLKVAAAGMITNWPIYIFAIFCSLVQIAWFFTWVIGTYGACEYYGLEPGIYGLTWVINLIGYFWGMYILQGLILVTVAGTFSRWWSDPESEMKTARSAFRACTSHFGSVAFGSLFTAILETIYWIFRGAASAAGRSGNCLLACILGCAACIVKCIESAVEYFNRWAFTYVGIEGVGFCRAGSRVMRLFKDRGWDAVINDSLIDNVLLMGSVCSGVICFFIGYKIGKQSEFDDTEDSEWILGWLGFLIGIATAHVIFGAVKGAIGSVFVLFADRPEDLRRNYPECFEILEEAWRVERERRDNFGAPPQIFTP